MSAHPDDPRSEAERARADLKRNAEMGHAVTETPLTHQPSVTPETFGVHDAKARARSGGEDGVTAGGVAPPGNAGTTARHGQSIAEAEQVATGRDTTRPVPPDRDADALTRAEE